MDISEAAKKHWASYSIVTLVFLGFLGWWVYLQIYTVPESSSREYFADTYGTMALVGAVLSLGVFGKWGGIKSQLGRAILALGLGLFAQVFGQVTYTYYALKLNVEVPYPSIGDIGFFGSVLFYIYAAWLLSRVAGAKYNLKDIKGKALAFLIPAGILAGSYYSFLREYDFTEVGRLTSFLDFGYPLGQAIFIAIAGVTFLLSRKLLGGIMRKSILLLLLALAIQYAADFNFLYQTIQETWLNGGYGDLIYLSAYFLMAIALLSFKSAYHKLNDTKVE